MFRSYLILVVVMMSLFIACDKNDDENPDERLELRIRNVSSHDYSDISIDSNGTKHNYGDLTSGATSSYVELEGIYMKAFVTLLIDNETFTLDPIDYVGEFELTDGKYTYEIDVFDFDNKQLSLNFINDN